MEAEEPGSYGETEVGEVLEHLPELQVYIRLESFLMKFPCFHDGLHLSIRRCRNIGIM